jgi:hypothetical protein
MQVLKRATKRTLTPRPSCSQLDRVRVTPRFPAPWNPLLRFVKLAGVASAVTACTPFKDDVAGADFAADAAPSGDDAPAFAAPSSPASTAPIQGATLCDPTKPFLAATLVPGLSLPAPWVGGLKLSPDYGTAYFHAQGLFGDTTNFDLYTATRPDPSSAFVGVAPLDGTGINTSDDENDPTVSGDGLTLVFGRSVFGQTISLHLATRPSVSMPFTYVGPIFANSTASYWSPFLRQDGQVLYLSNRTDAGADSNVYRATPNGAGFDPPSPVAEINSSFADQNPVVTPDDLTMYFHSRRPPGNPQGPGRIWVATRTSTNEPFSQPTNVAELNSALDLYPSFVTADGCTLYFFGSSPAESYYGSAVYVTEKAAP